ncbi:MAG TPA: M2 family metallopeptidase [Pirellulales bacterium]|nr:M2 family metallopeptidase [Pirellulales bacterium]
MFSVLLTTTALLAPSAAEDVDAPARKIIAEHAERIQPLEVEAARRFWDANVSGSADAYRLKDEADDRLDTALADRAWFERLKRCHESRPADLLLARQIELLYWQALPKQVDRELLKQLTTRANGIEMRFNAFRARVGDEQLTTSDVRRVLSSSTNSTRRREVWEASKVLGSELAPELLALVRLRNRAARRLGFADYHTMQLELNEQPPDKLSRLFDHLDALTREPFLKAKHNIDARLADQRGVAADELKPWHYDDLFFRDAPRSASVHVDHLYAGADIVDLCRRFYAGIGLPVDDVLAQSDLYEKPGKHPSAFCLDLDRAGDVRVLANVVPTDYWMSTMLHEMGHAVYSSRNMPRELPYLVRCESHLLTTEGLAILFERFSTSAEWLERMGVTLEDAEAFRAATRQARRYRLLVFSRLSQVIFRFERELYRDPDQDLNRLWWELVEKYQGLRRPKDRDEPDYASQLHIATAPAYFHNYLLGELFACQLHEAVCRDALRGSDPQTASYVGRREVGDYLRERVFSAGRRLNWNELAKFATGEELTARAFARDIGE